MNFEESMREIAKRHGPAMELLAKAHYCPDPDSCSFGNEGCIAESEWRAPAEPAAPAHETDDGGN